MSAAFDGITSNLSKTVAATGHRRTTLTLVTLFIILAVSFSDIFFM
jgi:hypothetical protein